jgi:hypothetical protein
VIDPLVECYTDALTDPDVECDEIHANPSAAPVNPFIAFDFEDPGGNYLALARGLTGELSFVGSPLGPALSITPMSPEWSPDARWLSFGSLQFDERPLLEIIRPDGSGRQTLTTLWRPHPRWDVEPSAVDFGTVSAGSCCLTATITVTNRSQEPLRLTGTGLESLQGIFVDITSATTCFQNRTLTQGESCRFVLRTTPVSQLGVSVTRLTIHNPVGEIAEVPFTINVVP